MRPPIFAQPVSDTPLHYLHRARMFRDAALSDYTSGEQNWPKYALLTHAAELALKAYVRHSVSKGAPASKEPSQHDLVGWYQLAVQHGLAAEQAVGTNLDILNDLHRTHYSRYPQNGSTPVPSATNIAGDTVEWLIDATQRVISR